MNQAMLQQISNSFLSKYYIIMINKYDIMVISMITIIITIIFVINIKKILNDKLSNIEVKIPQIEIPQPNIIIKVQRKCDSEEFDVHIDKDNTKIKKQVVGLSPISHKQTAEIHSESEQMEKFETVKGETINQNHIDQDRICITRAEYEKLHSNIDANSMKKYNENVVKKIIENDNHDTDPTKYFLEHRQIINTSFDDAVTKGANIGEYDSFANLSDIGKINLGPTGYKYPKPNHFIF
jgi:hypothetical protein